ncbi:vestitone reductase-like [Pistacia vera]|uniref:vestitone reductase-like n=1 Tax=Pistacia vera TaxID=55513 RepID=UPI0012636082|nr:vestitone reductase-like [Pistacia vera]XP_031269641.1 vestitone reductase-like [Pistacia vera]
MEGGKGTVCVTGGTGFVASWLIMKLLEHGYSVRTTVRAASEHNRDLSFLRNLPGASEKLQILNADLSDPDSFDAAIEGCSGVLHVATPIDFEGREPEEVVTKRAINGTIGILKACLKAKTVKRVVYTSSASAVVFNEKNVDIMDETFWSDVDFIRKTMPIVGSYMISKTLTEKAALEFAEEHGLDLVTLIPSFIVGPFICPKFPGSVRVVLAMVRGNKEEYSSLLNTSMVHVDDVARAHIFLLEHPGVKGRYICSSHTITIEQMSQLLSAKYPEYPIPTLDEVAEIRGYKIPGLSSKKLLDTGFEFKYGVDEMFDGAINCCNEKGFL